MPVDKLVPNDPRVQYITTEIRGKKYRYVLSEPEGTPIATMFLVHGFPDLSFGWRYQVPYFTSLGFRVVVPDMIGYGGTDAPQDLEAYTMKSISEDIKELAHKIIGEGQIILGGHDWGGLLVWRVAMWQPQLIKGVFSVCTPHIKASPKYVPLEDILAAGHLPNFRYQLQFKGPDVQQNIQGEEKIRQFLNGLYGGRTPEGELGFSTQDGVYFDKLPLLGPSKLLSKEELDYYAQQYMLQEAPQMRGPTNWYRMRELNWRDEQVFVEKGHKFEMPALFITASDDSALPPSMSQGMDDSFVNLTRGEVTASHWALWQAAEDVNQQVTKWVNGVLDGGVKSAL